MGYSHPQWCCLHRQHPAPGSKPPRHTPRVRSTLDPPPPLRIREPGGSRPSPPPPADHDRRSPSSQGGGETGWFFGRGFGVRFAQYRGRTRLCSAGYQAGVFTWGIDRGALGRRMRDSRTRNLRLGSVGRKNAGGMGQGLLFPSAVLCELPVDHCLLRAVLKGRSRKRNIIPPHK